MFNQPQDIRAPSQGDLGRPSHPLLPCYSPALYPEHVLRSIAFTTALAKDRRNEQGKWKSLMKACFSRLAGFFLSDKVKGFPETPTGLLLENQCNCFQHKLNL